MDNMEKALALREKERKLEAQVDDVKAESAIFERLVRRLVNEFCDELDDCSAEVDRLVNDIKRGKVRHDSQMGLEVKALKLSNAMYKATEGLSVLGSRTDVAKVKKQEMFNEAYRKTKDGTIPDKTAEANNQIVQELLMEKIMDRSYTVIGQKIKSANRLLETLKKIISSVMITKEVFRKEHHTQSVLSPEDVYDNNQDIETQGEEDL